MNKKLVASVVCTALALSACGDDGATSPSNSGPDTDGDGTRPEQGEGLVLGTAEEPAFAVHLRADGSAGVGLLDRDGELVREQYVTSGTELPGLSAFLHSDIAMPSNPDEDGVLTVLARAPANYVLRIDYEQGKVLSQFKTQLDDGGDKAAFSSNPYDYLFLDEQRAWVTRYQPNLDDKAKEMNRGDDLVLVNPTTGELRARVDLSDFYEDIEYTYSDFMTGEEVEGQGKAYARPNQMIQLGQHALVGLDRLTADFHGAAEGAILLLELDTNQVELVPLEGVKNCGHVSPVIGRDDAALVSCVGQPWGSRETVGLFLVAVKDGKVEVEQSFRPSAQGPMAVFWPVSVGGTRVVSCETGWATGGEDVLFVLDLASGDAKEFARFKEGGTVAFGGAYQPDTKMLLLGDRTASKVRRYIVDGDEVETLDALAFDPAFPVDGVYALARF